MAKLYIIRGASGSGKSTYAAKVAKELNDLGQVVSNTSIRHRDVKGWISLADEHNVNHEVIRVVGNFKNVHNVPEDKVKEMRDKFQPWDGETVIDNTVS